VAENILKKFNVTISPKGVEYYLDPEIKRTYSEAKKLAIKRGRMIYKKKPEHEKYKGKYVSAGARMLLLQKADYKCEMCGNGRHTGDSIEIHHKDFNEKNNDISNFQVLCFRCHRGLHEIQRESEAEPK
jgi:5-methylcytosine-specific restriction endonuclease McrA